MVCCGAALASCAEFRCVAFSGDNKFLVTLAGGTAPGYSLMGQTASAAAAQNDAWLAVWKWNAEKTVAVSKCNAAINRVRFVPRDSSVMSTSGPGYIRLWRCLSESLKELPLLPPKQELEVRCGCG